MWEIWTNLFLPKALKSCPKSNKLPNLVTLWIRKPLPPSNVIGPWRWWMVSMLAFYVLKWSKFKLCWKQLKVFLSVKWMKSKKRSRQRLVVDSMNNFQNKVCFLFWNTEALRLDVVSYMTCFCQLDWITSKYSDISRWQFLSINVWQSFKLDCFIQLGYSVYPYWAKHSLQCRKWNIKLINPN